MLLDGTLHVRVVSGDGYFWICRMKMSLPYNYTSPILINSCSRIALQVRLITSTQTCISCISTNRRDLSTFACCRRRIHWDLQTALSLDIQVRVADDMRLDRIHCLVFRILSVAAFIDSIYLCFSTGLSVLGWVPSTVTFGFAACSCRCPTTMRRRFRSIMAVETRSK